MSYVWAWCVGISKESESCQEQVSRASGWPCKINTTTFSIHFAVQVKVKVQLPDQWEQSLWSKAGPGSWEWQFIENFQCISCFTYMAAPFYSEAVNPLWRGFVSKNLQVLHSCTRELAHPSSLITSSPALYMCILCLYGQHLARVWSPHPGSTVWCEAPVQHWVEDCSWCRWTSFFQLI